MKKISEKEYQAFVSGSKKEAISKLNSISLSCDNIDAKILIDELRKEYESFGINGNNDSYLMAKEISENIDHIKRYVIINSLDDIKDYCEDTKQILRELKISSTKTNERKTRQEIIDEKLAESARKKLEKILKTTAKNEKENQICSNTKQMIELKEECDTKLAKLNLLAQRINKGNIVADTKFTLLDNEVTTIKSKMDRLFNEINNQSTAINLKDIVEYAEHLHDTSEINIAEVKNLKDRYEHLNNKDEEINSVFDGVRKSINAGNIQTISSTNIPSPSINHGTFISSTNVNVPIQNNLLEKTYDVLEEQSKNIEKEIAKIDTLLKKVDDELRSLFIEKDAATPSECIVIDSKINKQIAKRNGYKTSIYTYRNMQDQISGKQQLVETLKSQNDVKKINDEIFAKTNGMLSDISTLTNSIMTFTQKNNEELKKTQEELDLIKDYNQIDVIQIKNEEIYQKNDKDFEEVRKELGI